MEAVLPHPGELGIIAGERLRLLEISYYIRAGIGFAFSSFFLIYVVAMLGISFIPDSAWANGSNVRPSPTPGTDFSSPAATPTPSRSQPPPKVFLRIMAGLFALLLVMGWAFAALTAYAGWCIRKRRKALLIYIAAGLNCIFIPYGTFLGVMTFLTLGSPAGKLAFASNAG